MTETKQHTPGLNDRVGWDVETYQDPPNTYLEVWGRDKICTIKPFATERAYKECLANARLIAAAPELLEACTLLVSEIDHLEATKGLCVPSLGAIDRMKQAVAKATGGGQ